MLQRSWVSVFAVVMLFAFTISADAKMGPWGSRHGGKHRRPWIGVNWGFARTYWAKNKNDEGYAKAGTAATLIGLERIAPLSRRLEVAAHLDYLWMRSTVSTLICDTCIEDLSVFTDRTYFREIDLGANLHVRPFDECRNVYFGVGPVVRWGQSGRREVNDLRPGESRKATWFGISLLAGYRTQYGRRTAVSVEPRFTFSPDEADRWQTVYPPDNLSLQMGIYWR